MEKAVIKICAYRRDFEDTKYMSFFMKDDEFKKKYNKIWKKVKNTIDKKFDSDPVHNEKYLIIK